MYTTLPPIVFQNPYLVRKRELLRLQDTFICFGVRTLCSGLLKWFLDLMDKVETKFINHSSCVVLRNLAKFLRTVTVAHTPSLWLQCSALSVPYVLTDCLSYFLFLFLVTVKDFSSLEIQPIQQRWALKT